MAPIPRCLRTLVYILLVFGGMRVSAAGQAPYTPRPGSAERTAILDALRTGLKTFPDSPGLGFEYRREDVRLPEDIPITFIVHHLKMKEGWAWAEAEVKDYCCAPIHALLRRQEGGWSVQGMVNPSYVVCPESGEYGPVVQKFIYGEFRKKFPSVPPDVFPDVPEELPWILRDIEKNMRVDGPLVYFVRYFKRKGDWAWLEAHPRSADAKWILEPMKCLVHRERDRWAVRVMSPCCGECADDPDCAAGRDHRKVMRRFPQAPKDIFPSP